LHAVLLAQVLVHRTVDVPDQDRGRTVVFVAEFVPGWFQRFAMPAPVFGTTIVGVFSELVVVVVSFYGGGVTLSRFASTS